MRTYEEVKTGILNSKYSLMSRCQDAIDGGLNEFDERINRRVIQACQTYIENIDEVTTINIGATTNSLIRTIQKAYHHHLTDYWENFEKFASENIVGTIENGIERRARFNSTGECLKLGIGVGELSSCFKGKDPMNPETGDLFRNLINSNYGTNIPMAGVQKQALKDYEAVSFGTDQHAKDKAFVTLKEAQRDAGSLQNGGDYYLLATNQEYQAAKARLSGRNL